MEPGVEPIAEKEWVPVPDEETRVEASVVIPETVWTVEPGGLPEYGVEMRVEGEWAAEQETGRNLMSLEDLRLFSVMRRNGDMIQLDPKLASEDFQRELLQEKFLV